MLKRSHTLPLLGLLLTACGPTGARLPTPEEAPLPPAPPDHVVGDGVGPTSREAELDARRAVIEQLGARIEARTETEEREHKGQADRRAVSRVTSEAAFDHGELIEILGVQPAPFGFRARAVLSRPRARAVYQQSLAALDARLAESATRIAAAVEALDSTFFLKNTHDPDHLHAQRARVVRTLAALGAAPPVTAVAPGARARFRALRSQAEVRLGVVGPLDPGLQRSAEQVLAQVLRRRGCAVKALDAPLAEGPTANARLELVPWFSQEGGLWWLDFDVRLVVTDARSGRQLADVGGPRRVHAGGASMERAREAAVRQLDAQLDALLAPPDNEVDCRVISAASD